MSRGSVRHPLPSKRAAKRGYEKSAVVKTIALPAPFALFQAGFRPFFLLAGLDAVANMATWLTVYRHPELWPTQAMAATYWHAHEMLFGFAAAAIAGFLLTAVPNWTGRAAYRGPALYWLSGVWLAGRLVMLPFESHGYQAMESTEHVLWEMLGWFDRYVKQAPHRGKVASQR